jgi:phytoene desaturase (3,4-didehydrolycopene-forming)
VEYLLNTPTESIILDDSGRIAKGIRLESGEELHADLIVINADLVYAYNELLPQNRRSRNLKNRPASCSSISFFWAFDEKLPQLRAHNIFLAEQYRESFDAIFEDHRIPDEPSFYVNVPSKLDPTAAPSDKEAVVVLVPVGHLDPGNRERLDEHRWDTLVAETREIVLDTIEARTRIRGLRSRLVHEMVETPLTWEKKFNLNRGAILGLSHSFFNVLSFRPRTKHPDIERLYFVGASTHPGTGVPVCLAGSKLVTEEIVQGWNKGVERRSQIGLILAVLMALLVLLISLLRK